MPGAIVENLSGRKLGILMTILLICQIICFLIGGLIAPSPASASMVLATNCLDYEKNSSKWLYSRGVGACQPIDLRNTRIDTGDKFTANEIVFVFQLPLPRDSIVLDYSRWQQNLIGVLQAGITYHKEFEMKPRTVITIDAKLAYRNKGDPDNDWKYLTSSTETRLLDCNAVNKREGHQYDCSIVPLFELGSLHHDYYLLNVRFPVDSEKKINVGLGHVAELWLVVINQNGGFTKIWVSLKTVFFPFIIGIMVWFWKRVYQLQREPALLEKMLLFLGITLTLLNTPLEYLTLMFDMPYMLILGDIKQGIFYGALLSFWLIFAGEHLMINENEKSTLKTYWKHLSAVAIGCVSLFIFDMCERGMQLTNPFYSTWATEIGANFALTFIVLAGICACFYFIFLTYLIWKVFCNISAKKAVLPAMSAVRRLHYEGIIYRFKFLMLATLICAAMTVIGYILGQVSEDQWKWDDHSIKYTSAFFTGVYGMWNIYIFSLIVLYAPSHKQWPTDHDTYSVNNEEIEFSRLPTEASEMSSIAAFARKGAID